MFSKSNPLNIKNLFFKSCSENERTSRKGKSDSRQPKEHSVSTPDSQRRVREIIRASPSIYRYANMDSGSPTEFNSTKESVGSPNISHIHEQVTSDTKGTIKRLSLGKKLFHAKAEKEKVEVKHKIPLQVEHKIPLQVEHKMSSVVGQKIPITLEQRISAPIVHGIPIISKEHGKPLVSLEQRMPVVPIEQRIPVVPIEQRIPVMPIEQRIPVMPIEQRIPVMPVEQRIPIMPIEQRIPVVPIEQRIPITLMEPRIPVTSMKQEVSVPTEYKMPVIVRHQMPVESQRKMSLHMESDAEVTMGRKETLLIDEEEPMPTLRKPVIPKGEERETSKLQKPAHIVTKEKTCCTFKKPSLQFTKEDVMPTLQKPTLNIDDDEDEEEEEQQQGEEEEEEEAVEEEEEEVEEEEGGGQEGETLASMGLKTKEHVTQTTMDSATKKQLADLEFRRRAEMNLPKYVTKIIKKNRTNLNYINVELPDQKAKFASKIWPFNIPFVCPIYKNRKVPVVLSKTVNTVYQEGDEVTEVPCIKYKPYLVPVEVYVPKIVGTYLKNKKVDYKLNEQQMGRALQTSLMKKLNPHLDSLHKYNCEQQRYLDDVYNFSQTLVQKRNLKLPPIRRVYKNTPRFEVFHRRYKLVDGHYDD